MITIAFIRIGFLLTGILTFHETNDKSVCTHTFIFAGEYIRDLEQDRSPIDQY